MAGRVKFFLQRHDPNGSSGLLEKWLVDTAAHDLAPVAEVIRLSAPSPENPPERRIIPDSADLLRVSLACCYGSTRDDQFGAMNLIFNSLPTREKTAPELSSLQDQVDLLDAQLEACETLARHHCPRTLAAVRDATSTDQTEIVMSLCRRLADRRAADPEGAEAAWRA